MNNITQGELRVLTPAAEISVAALLKYIWLLVVLPFGAWVYNRLGNTYTKKETEKEIDMRMAPIIKELEFNRESRKENTKKVEQLNDSIQQLLHTLARNKINVYKPD